MNVNELIEKHAHSDKHREETRQFAIELLESLKDDAAGIVLVHESVNPFSVHKRVIDKALEELRK